MTSPCPKGVWKEMGQAWGGSIRVHAASQEIAWAGPKKILWGHKEWEKGGEEQKY